MKKKPTGPSRAFYGKCCPQSLAELKKVKLLLRSQAIAVKTVKRVAVAKGIDPTLTIVMGSTQKRHGIDPPLTDVLSFSQPRYGIDPPLTICNKKKNKKWKK